jgi:hypothetical protein
LSELYTEDDFRQLVVTFEATPAPLACTMPQARSARCVGTVPFQARGALGLALACIRRVGRHGQLASCDRRADRHWQDFFFKNKIGAPVLIYEDFVANKENYERTIRGICKLMGVEPDQGLIPPPAFRKQADSISLEWEQEYRRIRTATDRSTGPSISLRDILPMLAQTGVQLFSLQRDLRDGDAEFLRDFGQVTHLGGELATFDDTAAIMSRLDLVVSVDTSLAHLAGALGLFIALRRRPDDEFSHGPQQRRNFATGDNRLSRIVAVDI